MTQLTELSRTSRATGHQYDDDGQCVTCGYSREEGFGRDCVAGASTLDVATIGYDCPACRREHPSFESAVMCCQEDEVKDRWSAFSSDLDEVTDDGECAACGTKVTGLWLLCPDCDAEARTAARQLVVEEFVPLSVLETALVKRDEAWSEVTKLLRLVNAQREELELLRSRVTRWL